MSKFSTSPEIKGRLPSDLFLLAAAVVWGGGFAAQRFASLHLGFFAFNGIRFLLGGLALLPFVIRRFQPAGKSLRWILLSGLILFSASALQQAGIESTTAGAAGFITGVYVVLVPLLLAIFWRQPSSPISWVAALVALFGTYLLSTGGRGFNPSRGDLLVLAGAFVWALHVIVVGMAVKEVDVFAFSAGQFLFCGLLHLFMSLFIDPPTLPAIRISWWALGYAGLVSAALGFTLQALGQRKAPSSDAALILSLEAVVAAIAGALFLQEHLNLVQVSGCALILAAVLVTQLWGLRRSHA